MKSWLKKWGTAETVILASNVAVLALFAIFAAVAGFSGDNLSAWISYYSQTFSGSFANFLYVAILFICLVAVVLVIWTLAKSFITKARDPLVVFLDAAKRSCDMLLIIPAILFISIAAVAMGEANEFAPARLQDVRVIGWEHAIFGNYVFAALGNIHYPAWLFTFIVFSFENMALFLIGIGILLSYVARNRFRELLVAFCVGILLMIPIWLIVPVLSPQDRFIDNVYALPIPAQITSALASYHPQQELINFFQSVRKEKVALPVLPTSTFPSAHVLWATIAGYYLFRARRPWRWLGWVALPFLLASTFGTMLLAQHYFMDVPAGFVIAAIAIWLADGMDNAKKKLKVG